MKLAVEAAEARLEEILDLKVSALANLLALQGKCPWFDVSCEACQAVVRARATLNELKRDEKMIRDYIKLSAVEA